MLRRCAWERRGHPHTTQTAESTQSARGAEEMDWAPVRVGRQSAAAFVFLSLFVRPFRLLTSFPREITAVSLSSSRLLREIALG